MNGDPVDDAPPAATPRWAPTAMQAGHLASIAGALWFAFGGGAAAVVNPPDDQLRGGYAVVGAVAAVLLVAALAILVILHSRAVLTIKATDRRGTPAEHRAALRHIAVAALLAPLLTALLLPHLGYYPPPAPWLALLALVLSTVLLLGHAQSAWIGTRIRFPGPQPVPGPGGMGAPMILMIVFGALLLLLTLVTESARDTAAPWASTVQLVSAASLIVLPVRGLLAARRLRRIAQGDRTDERALAELSRRLHRTGILGAAVTLITVVAVVADPDSAVVAALRTALLVLALSAATLQLVAIIGTGLRDVS